MISGKFGGDRRGRRDPEASRRQDLPRGRLWSPVEREASEDSTRRRPPWSNKDGERSHMNMGNLFKCIYWVLFKVIFYFPNRKSTIWGIYSEYFLFFGDPLSKSKFIMIFHMIKKYMIFFT